MTQSIRRAAVIGAGVMGSGIAAHLANAGVQVLLLDIVPPNLTDAERKQASARNRFATMGLDKAVKARPAAFFSKDRARLVTIGNTEDDLEQLRGVDLVVEAIIEQIEPKRDLFGKLEKVVRDTCIVASNTSGLRIADMMSGRSESFRKRFLVMHFFNPVRYMKLLELVAGPDTSRETLERVRRFGEEVLGKGIVSGKDTPNFVGNRIGVHGLMSAIHLMLEEGLTPEDVDAITGEPMAHPKSASFRTADLVGIDTFVHVAQNCFDSLKNDEDRAVFEIPKYIREMVEKKLLGDKTKGGFYKKAGDAIETFDPKTLAYRPRGGDKEVRSVTKELAKIEDPRERLRKLVADPGKAGRFAWKALSRTMAYSARRIGEIADSVVAIDDAMKWGYNWELGPFEVWDALGFEATVDRMKKDGVALPASIDKMRASGAKNFYTDDGRVYELAKGAYVAREVDARTAPLTVLRKGKAPVLKNDGAEAWDLGDGVLGLTFKTKANSIDPEVIQMIGDSVTKAENEFRAMVLTNQGEYFCVGANLLLVVMAAGQKQWDSIGSMVRGFQQACQRMKYASVPVVVAPYNMTLGGGLELCLGAGNVQAAAETYAGLVEVGVGLVPGGGGTMNLLWRALGGVPEGANIEPYALVTQVFKNVALARVATSAEEAKVFGYFDREGGVSFDKARLVSEAKARAIGLAQSGWHPPAPRAYVLPGDSGIATLKMLIRTLTDAGQATEHDAKIATKLAELICGGVSGGSHEVTETEMLDLEREAFLSLCGEPKSQERMQYMLMNNKPLRN
jgi:3-hydroxyacyl-CoA dehydrogenase